jgi:thioredoxin 1
MANIEIIDFYSTWCAPCKRVVPVLETIQEKYPDVIITKINVEEDPATTAKYGVKGVPSIFFEVNGVIVEKVIGGTTPNTYMAIMEKITNE